jgi:imidazole glycerol-phosphate synthase subunit HisF
MSKRRLIPKLLLQPSEHAANKLVLVITKQFGEVIEIGNPISMAKIYQAQGADELIFTNIKPALTSFDTLVQTMNQISEEIFMPITVGGGVTKIEDFRALLNCGADKVSINTAAVTSPHLITEASNIFGAQCVVVSIDYKIESGVPVVYINGGQQKTELSPIEWAKQAEQLGAGEILLSCIDNDGMRNGLNNQVNQAVVASLNIPVIVSGGCSLPQHFIDGFLIGKADAVAAGTFFAFKDQSFQQIRSHIKNAGIDIRVYS